MLVCTSYAESFFIFLASRRAILDRKDRKKSATASGDVELVDVSSSVH